MLIDMLFLLAMIFAVIKGIRNGLIIAIFSIIGWIIGLVAAVKFSHLAAARLEHALTLNPRWVEIIAFVAVFLIVVLLINISAKLIEKTVELALLGWVNRLGGIFFYVLLYVLIFSVMLYFAEKVKLLSGETISSSKVYGIVQPIIITLKQLL